MNFSEMSLGLELGSTRIKAVIIDKNNAPVASGAYDWENSLVGGVWTYSYDEITAGLRGCFASLKKNVFEKYGEKLTRVGAIGISGMMHGYLPLNGKYEPVAEFRTWRNSITGEASEKLSSLFGFNVPQRWSIAHLYQAMLNGEDHLPEVRHLVTLSVYVTYLLTGKLAVGIGEASGMFPIDSKTLNYDGVMLDKFDALVPEAYGWKIRDVLPKVYVAGDSVGTLTKEGAAFLDPEGDLEAGIPFCAPEGDAGTGMVATNSVKLNTGNVSAGTSAFVMLVVDKKLSMRKEIDMVTTPAGDAVAMVHAANCTSDIDAWGGIFGEFAKKLGVEIGRGKLLDILYGSALDGDPDCGGTVSYNYYAGEHIVGLTEGRPMTVRKPDAAFTLANFMRANLYGAMSVIKIGLDILIKEEGVKINGIFGHGGFFKAPEIGQRVLSAAANAPVSVMKTAGEGGPYGMALLASYMKDKRGENLGDWLEKYAFAGAESNTVMASREEVEGFERYIELYKKTLSAEAAASKDMR